MIQTLGQNRWLLAMCGVLEAIVSVIYLVMYDQSGSLIFHSWRGTIIMTGRLMLAAAACAITAGISRSAKGKFWLLIVNGLALAGLGLISSILFSRFRISFHTVGLLVVAMALSAGILDLVIARTMRLQNRVGDAWFFGMASLASFGFASALGWIKLQPGSHLDLLWIGSYFGLSAISMLALAVRLRSAVWSGERPVLPPFVNPRPAH